MGLFRLPGRIVYAIAIGCFGVHHVLFAAGMSPSPGPPWYPHQDRVAWAVGACLLLAAASILTNWLGKWAAMALGAALLFRVAYIHIQQIVANVHDPRPWINAGVMLSMCGGAFALAGTLSEHRFFSTPISRPGQILFALPLFIFAAQFFIFGNSVATLMPGWLPTSLNWTYGIGVVFILAALAIIFARLASLASWLLGLMFLIWAAIFYAPRVIASPHNGAVWTSLFVALAMAGSAWAVAGSISK